MARMQMALDLYEFAEQIQRQNIRRRNPELSEDEVEERIVQWLQHRPGAELGDGVGRPTDRFSDLQ